MDALGLPTTPAAGGISGIDREQFEVFLIHEGRLLDDREFEAWMELFTEDGLYWVPSTQGQPDPYNQASLFFDDRTLMKTRIERLRHPRIHIQTPPSRTNH
ncbi:MAG: aromatic-ring-hydroxylating dioxygenase subunit beta, partial [Alphaproteobacteria bacterium]|nr:aromatic-ring-hydroxylating dioxygenase subunit beta [Alphaproteobacteria bacterium]